MVDRPHSAVGEDLPTIGVQLGDGFREIGHGSSLVVEEGDSRVEEPRGRLKSDARLAKDGWSQTRRLDAQRHHQRSAGWGLSWLPVWTAIRLCGRRGRSAGSEGASQQYHAKERGPRP